MYTHEFWKSTYISSAKPSHGHLVILLSHMVLPALFSTFELRSGLVRLPASNLWCLGFKHINFSMMQTFLLIFPSLFQIDCFSMNTGMPHALMHHPRQAHFHYVRGANLRPTQTKKLMKLKLAIIVVVHAPKDYSFKGVLSCGLIHSYLCLIHDLSEAFGV